MSLPEVNAHVWRGAEAYVALSHERQRRDLFGDECHVAEILHTIDAGRSWQHLPWRRSLRDYISSATFSRWPPEWVNRMRFVENGIEIEVFQDEGLSGFDPIYRAVWNGSRWRVRFARLYEYKTDGPIVPDVLMLSLPGISSPPLLTPYR